MGGDALRSVYMVQSLALGRGALSALVLMAVGESTSVLQNGWYIARAMRARSPVRLLLLGPPGHLLISGSGYAVVRLLLVRLPCP